MAPHLFGRWLIDRGLLTPKQVLNALDVQHETNKDLGQIAVEARMLTSAQADEIRRERERTDHGFGEIAEAKGLLTPTLVGRLLEVQRGLRRYLGEILVQEGLLTQVTVTAELEAFHGGGNGSRVGGFAIEQDDPRAEACLHACMTIFKKSVDRVLRVSRKEEGVAANNAYTVMQLIDAKTDSFLALSMPASEMRTIAERMTGEAFNGVNQMVLEAGKELINVIMGNVAGWLSTEDETYDPQPPEIVLDPESLPRARKTVTYFLNTPDAEIQLIVGYGDAPRRAGARA